MREQQSPPEYAVLAEVSNAAAAIRGVDETTRIGSWSFGAPSESNCGRERTDAPEVTRDWENAGRGESGIDLFAIGATEATWAPELKDHSRVDMSDDGQGSRVWFIAGALITAFSLGWAGGANSDRFLSLGSDTSARAHLPSASPGMVGSEAQTVLAKGDKVPSRAFAKEGPAAPGTRKVSAFASDTPEVSPPAVGARLTATSPTGVLPVAKQRESGPTEARSEAHNLARLTPAPETRPATIAGWTVRDVYGGSAVLEGPGGVWKVTTGDTVPGVGRVHSIVRWGGHWIVATSKGLIATR